jgi:hypothetical protein
MHHIALLGDSIIDNKAYVGSGPDISAQLRMIVPTHWRVSRLAVDGAVIEGVLNQLERLPDDVTHLVISAGGNNALGASGILEAPARSVADALTQIATVRDRFEREYSRCLMSHRAGLSQWLSAPSTILASLILYEGAWQLSHFR